MIDQYIEKKSQQKDKKKQFQNSILLTENNQPLVEEHQKIQFLDQLSCIHQCTE